MFKEKEINLGLNINTKKSTSAVEVNENLYDKLKKDVLQFIKNKPYEKKYLNLINNQENEKTKSFHFPDLSKAINNLLYVPSEDSINKKDIKAISDLLYFTSENLENRKDIKKEMKKENKINLFKYFSLISVTFFVPIYMLSSYDANIRDKLPFIFAIIMLGGFMASLLFWIFHRLNDVHGATKRTIIKNLNLKEKIILPFLSMEKSMVADKDYIKNVVKKLEENKDKNNLIKINRALKYRKKITYSMIDKIVGSNFLGEDKLYEFLIKKVMQYNGVNNVSEILGDDNDYCHRLKSIMKN